MIACLTIPAFGLRAALLGRDELRGRPVAFGPEPAGTDEAWEAVVHRLEEAGFAVEPDEPGCAYFETDGIERLAGGLDGALRRALDAVGARWQPRIGAAARRFTAFAARSEE